MWLLQAATLLWAIMLAPAGLFLLVPVWPIGVFVLLLAVMPFWLVTIHKLR